MDINLGIWWKWAQLLRNQLGKMIYFVYNRKASGDPKSNNISVL